MKVAIVGCRSVNVVVRDQVVRTVRDLPADAEIVSGAGGDVDTTAASAARHYGRALTEFPADWKKHGRAAGPLRNKQIVEYLDGADDYVIAFWDYMSRGTKSTIDLAQAAGKRVEIIDIREIR